MDDLFTVVDWSRAQFALTAIYHWLFVPLTLGLVVIIAIMETIYYRTKDEKWKQITKFWMTLFGVNFAIGVATGIILEFQFGTNWSNYSWFVGDIFGAPLAIEGIMAFFMEATFVAIMFFGWNKVSRGFHLTATWLTALGSTLSALWILVANAWMQYPIGMKFNIDTVRNEMDDFWAIVFSPIAINKFLHSVMAGWVLGGLFVLAVSAWFLLKKRNQDMALKSMKIGGWVGLIGIVMTIYTGDGSAYEVASKQPMKLAAMEGLYEGDRHQSIVAFGILNPEKKSYADDVDPFIWAIRIPDVLSFLATRHLDGFVPGIVDVIEGGYTEERNGKTMTALPAQEKIARGTLAIEGLASYKAAQKKGDAVAMNNAKKQLEENYEYFGYGYVTDLSQLVPHVPLVFYAFHIMVLLGAYFLLLFIVVLWLQKKNKLERLKWLLWVCLLTLPLGYLCLEVGWVVSEVGRQPWVIQDIMPTFAAISKIGSTAVQTTFWMFAGIFTILLIADVGILCNQIKKGPESNK